MAGSSSAESGKGYFTHYFEACHTSGGGGGGGELCICILHLTTDLQTLYYSLWWNPREGGPVDSDYVSVCAWNCQYLLA